ncbi:MAG TPA: hypothetical protein VNZ05_01145, partial [Solirubrobacteraceae bacterium]|nr:hypothetical protein [Solirubrobacteraceae bacterium]
HSAQLLRAARSNGAIFLALPANGPARNSINDESSLLRVMCQGSEATSCHGPMAAQAEFRTDGGTWKRVGGLLLIVAGVLGMLCLFGFIALRLLGAAIFSLLYLLLAPAAVLAPALGDTGRRLFRGWAARLLGAVLAKLVFAFLLGVVLAVLAILASLEGVGWWTQWLLMSAFWWGAFGRRHQALSVAGAAIGGGSGSRSSPVLRRAATSRRPVRRLAGAVRDVGARLAKPGREPPATAVLARVGRAQARAGMDEQARRSLEAAGREARARSASLPNARASLSAKRAQLARIESARADALARGDARRAAELGSRAGRVGKEIGVLQERLAPAEGARPRHAGGELLTQHARFLDGQARLPAGGKGDASTGERRDYPALAGLAGYGREAYERLDPRGRRAARLEVDRELALRKEMRPAAQELFADGAVSARPREIRRVQRAYEDALERRMRDSGSGMPVSRSSARRLPRAGRAPERNAPGEESSVMRDAREVAERRKRQLGLDRS